MTKPITLKQLTELGATPGFAAVLVRRSQSDRMKAVLAQLEMAKATGKDTASFLAEAEEVWLTATKRDKPATVFEMAVHNFLFGEK